MNLWKPIALLSIAGLIFSVTSPKAFAGGPCHDQPNMAQAADLLRQARGALDRAEHNKGGWRVNAIAATDKAISETQRGCAFDR